MQRLRWVDELRGVAIVLMVIFHFCYDLRYFGYVDWAVPNGAHWWPFRYLILTLFIFTLGLSLQLAQGRGVRWRKFWLRFVQIALAAAGVTLMSLYVFPEAWIYFGILHFLALASLLALPFVRLPIIALSAGLLVLFLYWSDVVDSRWPFAQMTWVPDNTEDYVPLFPWLGVAFVGVAAGAVAPRLKIGRLCGRLSGAVAATGRHGLLVYLVHQPLLFAAFSLVAAIRQ